MIPHVARLLPWSRRYVIHGLVLLILGPPAYEIAWWAKKTLRRVLSEPEAWVVMGSLAWSGQKQVSAMIRVKDEEEFLYPSVKSIADYVEEIVLIDNGSADRTPSVMESLRREYPHEVVCYQYNYEVRRQGWESWELALRSEGCSSPHLLASFYNWCLRQYTKPYILKWDGDMIATEGFSQSMADWRKSRKVVMTFKGVNVHPDGRHLMASNLTGSGITMGIRVALRVSRKVRVADRPRWALRRAHVSATMRSVVTKGVRPACSV